MWQYSDKVFEYFRNPKNLGEIENPDGRGEVGSDACGDMMQLTIKVDPETKQITDAKFKTFGCASAIASASVLTELIIGKTIRALNRSIYPSPDFLGSDNPLWTKESSLMPYFNKLFVSVSHPGSAQPSLYLRIISWLMPLSCKYSNALAAVDEIDFGSGFLFLAVSGFKWLNSPNRFE